MNLNMVNVILEAHMHGRLRFSPLAYALGGMACSSSYPFLSPNLSISHPIAQSRRIFREASRICKGQSTWLCGKE